MCIGYWKTENDEDLWKRLIERKVPFPETVKAIEYYYLLDQHQMIVIVEAPDETAIAKSALNWADIAEIEYVPAIPVKEYLKLRAELLK